MTDDLFKNKYRIKSTRLQGWDYSRNGYYFVTICVKNRECAFGKIEDDEMVLSDIGKMTEQCWRGIPEHFPFVKLDEFIIMPNHIHGIIVIAKDEDVDPANIETHNVETHNYASPPQHENPNKFGPQSKNLASIIRGFKVGVKKWATMNGIHFEWQPRFYDRIIRDEKELWNVRNYIRHNHLKWDEDKENPDINQGAKNRRHM
ncbi:hypothetical protein IIA29_11380 [candidate division KSB1 bacterium]|nr:hypothetical protein [candidate division KSB1 bacterium]